MGSNPIPGALLVPKNIYALVRFEFYKTNKPVEFWIEESRSGALSTPSSSGTGNFESSGAAWSTVWSIEYTAPNPQDYGIPPPPQNQFSA